MRIEDPHLKRIVRGVAIWLVSILIMLPISLFMVVLGLGAAVAPFLVILLVLFTILLIPVSFYILGWISEKTVEDWVK